MGSGEMKHPVKYRLEYIALRCVSALVNLLPYRAGLVLAWIFAAFAFHVLRFRRKETFRRIRFVLGEDTPQKRVKEIAWLSLRNTAFNAVEMMRAAKTDRKWVDEHIPGFAEEIPSVHELVEKYKGAVITVPHMGNWDLAGWACARHGVKMFSVAAHQRNGFINDWMNRQRGCGMTVLERGGGTMLQIMRKLRTGNVLAILPDVRVATPDLSVPFLGGEANIGRGMAMFAISAKVPIVPAIFRRVGWTRHAFSRGPVIYPDLSRPKEEEALRITCEILAGVDRAIREMPEQWFWYNKRWILFPVKKK